MAEITVGVDLPLGAIVATARVDVCVRVLSNGFAKLSEPADPGKVWVVDRLGQEHRDAYRMNSDPYGDYSEERWIWLLSRVGRVDPPIEATGRRGVWMLPLEVRAQLEALTVHDVSLLRTAGVLYASPRLREIAALPH